MPELRAVHRLPDGVLAVHARRRAVGLVAARPPAASPPHAIIASSVIGFLGVIGNYLLPDQIFGYLLASSGAIALFVYLVIALSQLRMRRQLDRAGHRAPGAHVALPVA